MEDGLSRRRFLAGLATVGGAAVAGCSSPTLGSGDGGDGGTTNRGSRTTNRDGGPGGGEVAGTATPVPDDGAGADGATNAFTRVYRNTIPSVALIRVFGPGGPVGQGTGWMFDRRHVVTNQHVVEGGTDVKVEFNNGEWRQATVLGTDVYSDLAALEVSDAPSSAAPLPLMRADPPVGTEVVALGNPLGFGESVSAGIVSGVDRSLPGANGFNISDAIQTDAAVNPGNSGGPLVTLDGEVAGVINSGGGDNIGFAISAALTRRVIPSLVEAGRYRHSYMGVRLLDVTPSVATANDLDAARGVIMAEVVDGGPSDGVLQGAPRTTTVNGIEDVPVGGDVVVGMGGNPIRRSNDLSTFLALETSPGDTIDVTVLRDGRRRTVRLTLGERPRP